MYELRKMLVRNESDNYYFSKIFQKLNKTKIKELEKYEVYTFNHITFNTQYYPNNNPKMITPYNRYECVGILTYPVWAFRKFIFSSINLDSAMDVIEKIVTSALTRQKVKKRYKNIKYKLFRRYDHQHIFNGTGTPKEIKKNLRPKMLTNYNHRRRNKLKKDIII